MSKLPDDRPPASTSIVAPFGKRITIASPWPTSRVVTSRSGRRQATRLAGATAIHAASTSVAHSAHRPQSRRRFAPCPARAPRATRRAPRSRRPTTARCGGGTRQLRNGSHSTTRADSVTRPRASPQRDARRREQPRRDEIAGDGRAGGHLHERHARESPTALSSTPARVTCSKASGDDRQQGQLRPHRGQHQRAAQPPPPRRAADRPRPARRPGRRWPPSSARSRCRRRAADRRRAAPRR